MSQAEWCTIESDPGVFTELIESFGVDGVQVEELYDLSQVHELSPVYGLIFLFKWQKEHYQCDGSVMMDDPPGLFFAKQVVQNACATQAIVSILLNCSKINIGQELCNFKEFAIDLPSDMRGLALANSQTIREAHNSFGRQESFEISDVKNDKRDDDAFHFISYLPFQGKLYELDGLKPAPVLICDAPENDWLEKIVPVIQERIQKYSETEIRFNLMAVIGNREKVLNERLAEMTDRRQEALARLNGTGTSSGREKFDLPSGKDELHVAVSAMDAEIDMIRDTIESERRKFSQWKLENERRKHNYIPFVFNLLQKLAEKNQLQGLIDKARTKQQDRRAAASNHLGQSQSKKTKH